MTTKVNGSYILDDHIVGYVEDLDTKHWFGKVTLRGMEEFSEYGTLDQNAYVQGNDGILYTSPY